jgi:glycerol-3-phosphate dehydrogenase
MSTTPFAPGWRERTWQGIGAPWDVVVVGGGITGAGILAVAARAGLRVLLVEQGDLGSGTSSRSSKLVHGGLRYLRQMQIKLTRQSVRERQRLLAAAPGLVDPMPFLYPIYDHDPASPWQVGLGLSLYTHMAPGAGSYERLQPAELETQCAWLRRDGLRAGFRYGDATTDDARLVLRVIHDALRAGQARVAALSYARVLELLGSADRATGVVVRDLESGVEAEVPARVVINAAGAWSDGLRRRSDRGLRLRPLRGSHLYVSPSSLPLTEAVAFAHPEDHRPVFAYPWQGVILIGTTDVDHDASLDQEPRISAAEMDYLLRGVQTVFPELYLQPSDVVSTQAGVRPVIDTGKDDPSSESREHLLTVEQGLVTVTGGKLTTFRPIAIEALQAAHEVDARVPEPDPHTPVVDPVPDRGRASTELVGRHGAGVHELVESLREHLVPIAGTPYVWAQARWALEREAVVHLSDLLLRRLRCGILRPDGGGGLLDALEAPTRRALGWSERRWQDEVAAFHRERELAHGVPGR